MSTISTDFRFFIEQDSNPFILYSSLGAVIYLNKSAELLMEIGADAKIFNLASTHAPQSFGSKMSLMNLSFSLCDFYAINVLYNNDDEIGIHLYSRPRDKLSFDTKLEGYTNTDINLLLRANIELFSIDYAGELNLLADYDLPEFQMHQNRFSLLLKKIFLQFKQTDRLDISMTIKIGAAIVINQKRYPIIVLRLSASQRDNTNDNRIRALATQNHIDAYLTDTSIALEIPTIT